MTKAAHENYIEIGFVKENEYYSASINSNDVATIRVFGKPIDGTTITPNMLALFDTQLVQSIIYAKRDLTEYKPQF